MYGRLSHYFEDVCVLKKLLFPSDEIRNMLFVPWLTDQMNLEVSGSQRRQGLLGLESPSVKHIPSMLHVLSWQPETQQRRQGLFVYSYSQCCFRLLTCRSSFTAVRNTFISQLFVFLVWCSLGVSGKYQEISLNSLNTPSAPSLQKLIQFSELNLFVRLHVVLSPGP